MDSQSETPEATPREPQGQGSKGKRDQRQQSVGGVPTPEKPSEKKPKVDFAPAPAMVFDDSGDQD